MSRLSMNNTIAQDELNEKLWKWEKYIWEQTELKQMI